MVNSVLSNPQKLLFLISVFLLISYFGEFFYSL